MKKIMFCCFMVIFVLVSSNVSVDAIFYPDMVHSEERIYYGENDSRNNPFLVNQSSKNLVKDRLGSAELECWYFFFRINYSCARHIGGEFYPSAPYISFTFYSDRFKDGINFRCVTHIDKGNFYPASVMLYSGGIVPIIDKRTSSYYWEFSTGDVGPLLMPNESFRICISSVPEALIYYYWELY